MTNLITSKLRVSKSALLVAGVVTILAQLPAVANDDSAKTARYYRQQAAAAYKAKDYAAAIENFKKAAELIPDHPTLHYNLACVYALAGKKQQALASLAKIAEMGVIMPIEKDGDLDSIKGTPEFKLILKRLEASKLPVVRSTTAFTIHEKGLITEGLAYDPVEETFFVSSVHKRRILKISKKGEVETFASEQDGLFSALGMSVDAKRRHLWVTSAAFPQMVNFKKDEQGLSAVFKFDLRSNKLLKKYVLSNETKKHALGDLVIQSNGDVFTTDSLSPAVYVIRAQKDEIELFLEDPGFGSPQGLAFSLGEQHLFMADYSTGLFDIDVKTKKVTHLAPLAGATMLGIDGLYFHKGGLIAVQNGVNPQRVLRISLSKDLARAERLEVLEANNPVFLEPTLGVLVRGTFYFIANSQWPLVDENGKLAAEERLRDPVVLKINLDAR
ncbi:MAG TPA: tetratricopeptide repeat protein [Blastocatellia bacterium]|nr:tetratricopeptide repeat protein [Blastocatellia bacterium]